MVKRSLPFISLATILILLVSGCSQLFTAPPGQTQATEYEGVKLTPIQDQPNNALAGTQYINQNTYRLAVNGMVTTQLSLSYQDLLNLPQVSELATLECVEGWSFVAKWTGPTLASILALAGVQPGVTTVIFDTTDVPGGYTSLDLSYIESQNIIIALKLNDITLPADRGFPFQVVAVGKYGYKWAKWVTTINLSSDQNFRGYWERRGYSNEGDIIDSPFG